MSDTASVARADRRGTVAPRSDAGREFDRFLRAELPSPWVAALDSEDLAVVESVARGPDGVVAVRAVAGAGYLTPEWPIEFGGRDLDPASSADVKALLRAWRIADVRVAAGSGWIGPTVLRYGTHDQCSRLLPAIARAEEYWCQLFSEPDAGSDLASLRTRASLDHDGAWRVTGVKVWVSRADIAHRALLLARTESDARHAGITAFCVDLATDGIHVAPIRQMTGDCEFFEVRLDDVAVADRDRLGARGEGWSIARTVLAFERSAGSGLGAALPGSVVGRDIGQLLARHRGAGSVTKDALVRLWMREKIIELTNHRAAAARAAGSESGPPPAATKILQAIHTQRLQEFFVNGDGQGGCAWEQGDAWAEPNAWAFLRTRAKTIAGGTTEVLKSQVAERVLGLPRS